ncbi:MAG: response regulator transcription factor [candidate division NC10 bacterium]|nr:response regulator transcription factor [candidate division NC10 bacterium]
MKIRVLIADDHALFREGIRALLSGYDDLEVVGEAADGREAIEQVKERRPDIVLMDIAMPGLGGLEATLELKKLLPGVKILILTQYDNREYLYRFLKAGASGYVLKRAAGTELVAAIRAVHQGGTFLHPEVAPAVVEGYLGGIKPSEQEDPYETLTDREKQVLKLVAEGRTNKEIAGILGISVKTAMGHRANLMEKLGIHNRAGLVKFALQRGIIA